MSRNLVERMLQSNEVIYNEDIHLSPLLVGLLASSVPDVKNSPYLLLITGVGGLIIMAIGCNLLELVKIRVGSFLPAIAIAPLVYFLFETL